MTEIWQVGINEHFYPKLAVKHGIGALTAARKMAEAEIHLFKHVKS